MADIAGKYLDKLAALYYLDFTVSPVMDIILRIYLLDKFGNPRMETCRAFKGKTPTDAIINAGKQLLVN